jgi:glycosyltransferase involved in cell wall biosynthesis
MSTTDSKPLVSVVIAAYNMANYLPMAIESVLTQTYENVEILVVDDGSTDATEACMQGFLQHPKVKYIRQANQGQAVAKNRGVREAAGEFVAFLDADDTWVSDKLELQMRVFSGVDKVGVVYSKFYFVDPEGKIIRESVEELRRGKISGPLLVSNFIGFGTTVVRKSCFDRLGYFNEEIGMGIDYDLWLRYSAEYEFDFIDKPLLNYRVWDGQMSKNYRKRYLNGMKIMREFLASHPDMVDRKTMHYAWAHTYVGYGHCLRGNYGETGGALGQYVRALWHKPTYGPAWVAIARAVLGV